VEGQKEVTTGIHIIEETASVFQQIVKAISCLFARGGAKHEQYLVSIINN